MFVYSACLFYSAFFVCFGRGGGGIIVVVGAVVIVAVFVFIVIILSKTLKALHTRILIAFECGWCLFLCQFPNHFKLLLPLSVRNIC